MTKNVIQDEYTLTKFCTENSLDPKFDIIFLSYNSLNAKMRAKLKQHCQDVILLKEDNKEVYTCTYYNHCVLKPVYYAYINFKVKALTGPSARYRVKFEGYCDQNTTVTVTVFVFSRNISNNMPLDKNTQIMYQVHCNNGGQILMSIIYLS